MSRGGFVSGGIMLLSGGGGSIGIGTSSKGRGTGATITTSAITTAATGSTQFIGVIADVGLTVTIPNDSKGNAYTVIGPQQSGAGMTTQIYACSNSTGGSGHTVSANLSPSGLATVFHLEITNAAVSSVDSGSAAESALDSTSPFDVTSNAFAQAVNVCIAMMAGDSTSGTATLAELNGFTIQIAEENGASFWPGGLATKITAATTALTASFTQSGTANGFARIVGIKQ